MNNASTVTIAELLSRPTISPEQFMQITGSGRNSTYSALASGQVKSFRVGRNHKISTAWLKAMLHLATPEAAA
jgi:hypothetical protein